MLKKYSYEITCCTKYDSYITYITFFKFSIFLSITDVLPDDTMNVIVTSKPFNSRKKKDKLRGPMWKQTESMLRDFHKQYNQQLANILGDEGYLWSVDS